MIYFLTTKTAVSQMATFLDSNASNFAVEMARKEIYDLIKRAYASHGAGCVYGNFVRQVMIPKYVDSKAPITLCDVDFYFDEYDDMKMFLKQEKERLLMDPHDPNKYLFCVHDTVLTRVTVTDQPPPQDLDIECVQVILKHSGLSFSVSAGVELMKVIENVKLKRFSLTHPEYFLLTDPESKRGQLEIASKIFSDFLQKGWKLILDSEVCGLSALEGPEEITEWIRFDLQQKDEKSFLDFVKTMNQHHDSMLKSLLEDVDRVAPSHRELAQKMIDDWAFKSASAMEIPQIDPKLPL